MAKRSLIYLIDPPTFPRGVISLSFPAIAACLPAAYKVQMVDLNLNDFNSAQIQQFKSGQCLFAGLKVSCQNYLHAAEITQQLKQYDPELVVIWGGEYPTLLPDSALSYADAIVSGAFENVANDLIADIEQRSLQKIYDGQKKYNCSTLAKPDYSVVSNSQAYLQAMGFPFESSRGCDKKCTFCMVHSMQPLSNFKSPAQLKNELSSLAGKFVNVVDYNIGVDREHLENLIQAFTQSQVPGWMGEMCLETLDDDALLKKLADSRCRIIYCGLESVSEDSLRSVNKAKTNNVDNYTRIIKKAQAHGIQIAAGIIIGLEGATREAIHATFRFYHDIGLIYTKITFLTYNPGTKVFESMKRVGSYLTEEPRFFDGNHFTFLPQGVNQQEITQAMIENIKAFYSLKSILKRAAAAGLKGRPYREFIYFNIAYRDSYLKWLKYGIFENEDGFKQLLSEKFRKTIPVAFADRAITQIRKKRAALT